MIIRIQGRVWKYPGPHSTGSGQAGGWYFVYVPDKASQKIRKAKDAKRVGFGFVPVTATLGKTSWKTTLFPTKEGPYLISIKASVRAKESVREGATVGITCAIA